MPVLVLVAFPCGFITVSYLTSISAGVAGRITRVVINVNSLVCSNSASGAFVPMLTRIRCPFLLVMVSVAESGLDNITTGRAGLRGCFGSLSAGGVCLLTIGCSAYRALVPMSARVAFPFCFISVGYRTNIATGVTACVARIVIIVSCLAFFVSADRTLMPMLGSVLLPCCFVGVSYGASIATGVTCRIAGIVVFVSRLIFFVAADRALMPMLRRVIVPSGFIGVGDGSNITTGITGRVTSVVENVITLVFFVTATRASMPVFA